MLRFLPKTIVLFVVLFLTNCAWEHKGKETINPYDAAKQKRDYYVKTLDDVYSVVDRCDGSTFVGLWDAYGKNIEIYEHEYPEAGKWNRDVETCYPEDSRSAISTESLLGILHALWARGDKNAIKDIQDYGRANGWVMGEGPKEYTNLYHLSFLIEWMLDEIRLNSMIDYDPWDVVSGYRANVIADYITLKGDVTGSINALELDAIEVMKDNVPQSPIYQALWHKYTDGDQAVALGILGNDDIFPPNRLPEKSLNLFDWGNAPAVILYIFAFGIIENDD